MHELAYKVDYTAYIELRNYKINKLSYHPLIKLWLFKEFIIHCHLQFKLAIKHIYFCRFKNNLLSEVTVYIARKYLRAIFNSKFLMKSLFEISNKLLVKMRSST